MYERDNQEEYQHFLLKVVKQSALSSHEGSIAAANAITLLNRLGFVFSGLQLKNIRIPHASLIGAMCQGANLSGADLSYVNFTGACLDDVDFSAAKMEEVELGFLPFLAPPKFQGVICQAALSSEERYLLVETQQEESKSLIIWDLNTYRPFFETLLIFFEEEAKSDEVTAFTLLDDLHFLCLGHSSGYISFWTLEDRSLAACLKLEGHDKKRIQSLSYFPLKRLMSVYFSFWFNDPFSSEFLFHLDEKKLQLKPAFTLDSHIFCLSPDEVKIAWIKENKELIIAWLRPESSKEEKDK